MKDVLSSGKTSFKIEVPYKLIEVGEKKEKPLIIYLHGYKQNLVLFKKKVADLMSIEAYHLFLQGPYPIYDEKHNRKVAQWGRAWYLYDGEQDQFIKSMEISSEFIQELIDNIVPQLNVSRLALLGYSMGGYLAGYFALSRPCYVNDLIVVGGRIKTETFPDNRYENMHTVHLHGKNDASVSAERAQESCKDLERRGAEVTFVEVEEGHKLTHTYIKEIKKWFLSKGYIV